MKKGYLLYIIIFAVIMGLAVILGCAFGAAPLTLEQVIKGLLGQGTEAVIVRSLRLPRVLAALLAGGGLTVCGCALQGLFRNPMAAPDILGASSGACFGAALAILFGASSAGITACAFVSSLLTVLLVYLISIRTRGSQVVSILLSGVMISSLFS